MKYGEVAEQLFRRVLLPACHHRIKASEVWLVPCLWLAHNLELRRHPVLSLDAAFGFYALLLALLSCLTQTHAIVTFRRRLCAGSELWTFTKNPSNLPLGLLATPLLLRLLYSGIRNTR